MCLIKIQVICDFKIQKYILYKLILSQFSGLAGLLWEVSLSLCVRVVPARVRSHRKVHAIRGS